MLHVCVESHRIMCVRWRQANREIQPKIQPKIQPASEAAVLEAANPQRVCAVGVPFWHSECLSKDRGSSASSISATDQKTLKRPWNPASEAAVLEAANPQRERRSEEISEED